MDKKGFFKANIRLLPKERIIFRSRPHIIFLILPLALLAFFGSIYLSFICPFVIGSIFIDPAELEDFCYLISGSAFLFVMLVIFLDWWFNRLYLTSLRLIRQRGIIGKRFVSIRLDRIEDVSISYGFWGWLLCFGCLEVESAGHYGQILFRGAPWLKEKKYLIEKEMMRK